MLHHGRGSDERDLIGLADILDPSRRLHIVSPRAPLQFQGSPGHHWYVVERVGFPHAETFLASLEALGAFHAETRDRVGLTPEQTILAGFSQGSVMSFATGLSAVLPAPAGILGISGFIPTVVGWLPDFTGHSDTRVLVAHGRNDPVIPVTFGRQANELLSESDLNYEYLESDAGHNIDPPQIPTMTAWLSRTLAPAGAQD